MKNIKYIVLSIGMAFGITACQDAYEIDPVGLVDEEAAFYTLNEAQTVLDGTYSQMNNMNQIAFTAIFTDELAPSVQWNGSNRDVHQMILNSTSGFPAAIWLDGHAGVNRANRILNGLAEFEPADGAEETRLNDMRAQARFIRAYSYLTLLSYFSPNMEDNDALGAILFEDVATYGTPVKPRATNGEIYQLMEEDLNFAVEHLKGDNFIYPTKAAAEAIMARMYAYRGMYQQAAVYANHVINNYGLSLTVATPFTHNSAFYSTASPTPYKQMWLDYIRDTSNPNGNVTIPASQLEQILTLRSQPGEGTPSFQVAAIFFQNGTACSGSPLWSMSYRLHEMYSSNPNDVRLYAFVDPTTWSGAGCNGGEVMIDKYPGIGSANPLVNNLKLIRLSEMYMILAEAAASNGDLTGAANYIYQVEVARSTTGSATMPSFSSTTDAWAGILEERRKEFFAEGYRYVDLKRLGAKANVSIDRDQRDNENPGEPLTIPIDDHRFTLPIPFNEISVNPDIVQNPGY